MNPASLMILAIILLLMLIFTLYKLFSNISFLRARHRDQIRRVKNLKLSRMLEHLGIPFKHYLHKTSELDKERHIWACEHCPHPDKCERMFKGEDLDPLHFCPNYRELKKLKE